MDITNSRTRCTHIAISAEFPKFICFVKRLQGSYMNLETYQCSLDSSNEISLSYTIFWDNEIEDCSKFFVDQLNDLPSQ